MSKERLMVDMVNAINDRGTASRADLVAYYLLRSTYGRSKIRVGTYSGGANYAAYTSYLDGHMAIYISRLS